MPYSTVQHICRSALKRKSPGKRDTASRRLEQQHVDYLLSEETLRLWAGMTLKQRCKLFHRRFVNKTIPVTSLRKLYIKHGVKRKKVRQEKLKPPHIMNEFSERCKVVLNELEVAHIQSRKLLYLDELNFTKLSFQNVDWSVRRSNRSVDQRNIYTGYKSVIVTVSADCGLERYDIYDQAITATEFIKHLEKLRKINGDTRLAIFMDQLGVHKTKEVVERYKELDILKIENVSYSPEFNPIEACFS